MVLKATANDRRHLALCHDEFRGPRSGLCRSEFRHNEAHGWYVAGAEAGQSKIDGNSPSAAPLFRFSPPVLDQSAPDALVCLELREWNGLLLFVLWPPPLSVELL
ncbi:hypothetical protein TNCV_4697541 [Trichonephila clavipes]|nr:hypothetical protein TNCV_4697541 [Trichonephila clavipes]